MHGAAVGGRAIKSNSRGITHLPSTQERAVNIGEAKTQGCGRTGSDPIESQALGSVGAGREGNIMVLVLFFVSLVWGTHRC